MVFKGPAVLIICKRVEGAVTLPLGSASTVTTGQGDQHLSCPKANLSSDPGSTTGELILWVSSLPSLIPYR